MGKEDIVIQPPLTFANALSQLGILTSQTANFTFNNDEMTQALTTAWQDSYVGQVVWDTSLTYQVGTFQYAIPPTMTVVREIYIITSNSNSGGGVDKNYPEKISPDLYEIVAGNIQFVQEAQQFINDTYTLYLKGWSNFSVSTSLVTQNQINYVLSNAAYILLRTLLLKSVFVFLRNDTNVAAIKAARDIMYQDKELYKQTLLREFESA